MIPLTPISKQLNEFRFQTVETYFDSGMKAFGLVFFMLGIYLLAVFEDTIALPVILMGIGFVVMTLQTIYIIDLQELYYENYWRILMLKFKRGDRVEFTCLKAIIVVKENRILKKMGNMEFGGHTSVSSSVKVPSNYQLFLKTELKDKILIGEFVEQKDFTGYILRLLEKYGIEGYSVQIKESRKLSKQALYQGRIRLKTKEKRK